MSTVVHELFGHPEFDDPTNDHLALFQLAGPKDPRLHVRPGRRGRLLRLSRVRDLLTFARAAVLDRGHRRAALNYDPRQGIGWQLDAIKEEWEPKLAAALVRGLYKRFALDPRIEPMALSAFSGVIKKKFPAEHAAIVK